MHQISCTIRPSHPLLGPFPSALNLSQHQVAKVSEFQLQQKYFNEYSGLISIRIGCFDLFAVQGTLKSILQQHSSKPSIIPCSLPVYFNSPIIAKLCLCFWIYSLDGYRFSSKDLARFFFHGCSHHLQWIWSPKKYSLSLFPFPPMFSLFDVKWLDQLPWSSFFQCWDLSQVFHSPLFFISRLFSYSSLFVIYVVSRAYLRLLIFLQAILILVWVSSSLALHTMCSEYKLDKPHNNIQPWCTPFQFETSAFFHVQF